MADRLASVAELVELAAKYARGEDVVAELSAFVARMRGEPQLVLVAKGDERPLVEPEPAEPVNHRETVSRLFAYWQRRTGHTKARLTPERASRLLARLRQGYTEADIKAAIDGCASSEFHSGHNESGTVYDDIELICRSGSNVERFSALAGGAARYEAPATPTEKADERKRALMAEADRLLKEGNTSEYNRLVRAIRTGKGA